MPDVDTEVPEPIDAPVLEVDEAEELGDLAALAEADQDWRWQVHRLKSREEQASNPRGKPRVWVTTIHGPVDLADFHQRRGGGTYEFWGSHEGSLRRRVTVELDGLPKPAVEPSAQAVGAPGPPPVNNATDPSLLRLMVRLDDRLERLERIPAPAEKSSITELVNALGSLDAMRHRGLEAPANPDKELFSTFVAVLQQGIELGQAREPIPAGAGGTDWVKVIETAAPIFNRVFDRMGQRHPVPRTTRPPVEASHAEVLDHPGATPDDMPAIRMQSLVDSMARAIAEQVEPADFAGTVEHILTAEETAMLRMTTAEALIADLRARAGGRYPILNTEDAQLFVDYVLTELRTPAEVEQPS